MQIAPRLIATLVLTSAAATGAHLIEMNAVPAASQGAILTVTAVGKKDAPLPAVKREDVQLTVRKERKQLAEWTKGQRLYLAVLIDEALDTSAASQWNDPKQFLTAQPESTYELVAYARNGTAAVAQDSTNQHELAVKALRIPTGNLGAYASPYLSLIDLMKRLPGPGDRRTVVLISSGIDYFRGGFGPKSPDLDSAIERAQRENINVWSIYSPGVGFRSRSFFRVSNAQSNLSQLSEETGAESYYMGASAPVSFKPYLDEIQTHLGNQYLLTFQPGPVGGKKGKLERVRVGTELENIEFMNANQVYLPPSE